MILISHRGNINGKEKESENNPEYINKALTEGYDVEIDVWFINNNFYLGHDIPQFIINKNYLLNTKLWCHAKNIESLIEMSKYEIHFFWHESDRVTLTSRKFIWAYPTKKFTKGTIGVLPEVNDSDCSECVGICSDLISKYKI